MRGYMRKVGLRKPLIWETDPTDWAAVPYDQGGVIGGPVVVTNDTYEPIEVRTADEPYVPEWLKGTFESSRRRLDGVHAALADDHQHCTCTFHTECCYCAGREH